MGDSNKKSIDLPFWYNVIDQNSINQGEQCSWTLYFIFFSYAISFINKTAG